MRKVDILMSSRTFSVALSQLCKIRGRGGTWCDAVVKTCAPYSCFSPFVLVDKLRKMENGSLTIFLLYFHECKLTVLTRCCHWFGVQLVNLPRNMLLFHGQELFHYCALCLFPQQQLRNKHIDDNGSRQTQVPVSHRHILTNIPLTTDILFHWCE